jgi:hypothetical protein
VSAPERCDYPSQSVSEVVGSTLSWYRPYHPVTTEDLGRVQFLGQLVRHYLEIARYSGALLWSVHIISRCNVAPVGELDANISKISFPSFGLCLSNPRTSISEMSGTMSKETLVCSAGSNLIHPIVVGLLHFPQLRIDEMGQRHINE